MLKYIGVLLLLSWLFLFMLANVSESAEIDSMVAYKCLLGEVRGESKETILATAYSLKNRGTTKGVYGCKVNVSSEEMKYIESIHKDSLIKWAWSEAMTSDNDPTHGATHWENIEAFGKPYWADSLIKTVVIGTHTFYKER